MDKNTFETAEPIVDEIADSITNLMESQTEELRTLLARLNKAIGNRYHVDPDTVTWG